MFSKADSKKLREEFWIAFGKSYPNKWILYHTQCKGLALKFHFDLKKAMVALVVETTDVNQRQRLWEKLLAVKSILLAEYLPEAQYEASVILENQKELSRIRVQKEGVSIHNKNSWQETMLFLNHQMTEMERFFRDYEDFLRS